MESVSFARRRRRGSYTAIAVTRPVPHIGSEECSAKGSVLNRNFILTLRRLELYTLAQQIYAWWQLAAGTVRSYGFYLPARNNELLCVCACACVCKSRSMSVACFVAGTLHSAATFYSCPWKGPWCVSHCRTSKRTGGRCKQTSQQPLRPRLHEHQWQSLQSGSGFPSNATLVWIFYSVTDTCFGLMAIFRRKYIYNVRKQCNHLPTECR
jgi:hypothetical protein